MSEFKKYIEQEYNKALKSKHFNPEGNSNIAICKRSFYKHLIKTFPHTVRSFKDLLKHIPELIIGFFMVVGLILLPITFPLSWILMTFRSKQRAKKCVHNEYAQHKINNRSQ